MSRTRPLGYVFTPGPQTARHQIFLPDGTSRCLPRISGASATSASCLWIRRCVSAYNGNHVSGTLRYVQSNLPASPEYGPVLVVNHPNNAPTGTFPDLRASTSRPSRPTFSAPAPATTASPSRRPARCRCPSPTARSASACRARTNGGPIPATRQPDHRQRCRVLVRRPPD